MDRGPESQSAGFGPPSSKLAPRPAALDAQRRSGEGKTALPPRPFPPPKPPKTAGLTRWQRFLRWMRPPRKLKFTREGKFLQ